ncbi:CLUMA_CG017934, isoform A [Clunio marinus]|uniref:CLUMA_CG017934, isoform A n=1 Tax=Clunio marinus TaxID=568069 RepID=A0A1J1IX79_9DIPT|nr:CLUMA_CG017934, isoform A [Clunio marinus]
MSSSHINLVDEVIMMQLFFNEKQRLLKRIHIKLQCSNFGVIHEQLLFEKAFTKLADFDNLSEIKE